MDRLKNLRAPVRATVTKLMREISEELAKENPSDELLQLKLNRLLAKQGELRELDDKVKIQLVDDGIEERAVDQEHQAIEEYEEKVEVTRMKIEGVLHPVVQPRGPSPTPSASSISSERLQQKNTVKLPKMEIKKFNGDIKQWLGFWAQFEKIHEDESIDTVHKFQILVQSMEKDSRAKKVVESYPQSAENYQNAVDALQQRFGRKNLLIEVYTRDLIKLIIEVIQTQEKVNLTAFYDELETHLLALGSLGVSGSTSTLWLLPLVESCLPEETLRVWQRSREYGKEDEQDGDDRLDRLMQFIRSEVEHEEKIKLARSGLAPSKRRTKIKGQWTSYDAIDSCIPTAADLFSADSERPLKCIFCEKGHESEECFSARKLSLDQKKQKIQSSKGCYVCFRRGHLARNCNASLMCQLCEKKHYTIMCPELPHHKNEKDDDSGSEVHSSDLHAGNNSKEVLLQTIVVNLNGNKKSKLVRALFDGGSQRSYILKNTAVEVGLEAVSEMPILHELFGGNQVYHQHKKYKLHLENKLNSFRCNFDVLDQEKICGRIAQVPRGQWLEELRSQGIQLTDVGDGAPEIEVLIGADVMGRLLTTNVYQFNEGLTAVETRLGWTLMGKVPGDICEKTSSPIATSMTVHDISVSDLWSLQTVGIRDSAEAKYKTEMETEDKEQSRFPWWEQGMTQNRPAHQLEVRIGSAREGRGRRLSTFVDASKHGGKEMRNQTGEDAGRHVPGIRNPADLPSKGRRSPLELLRLKRWEGPNGLEQDPHNCPKGEEDTDEPFKQKNSTVEAEGRNRHGRLK